MRVDLHFKEQNDQNMMNRYYIQTQTDPSPSQLQTFATACRAEWHTAAMDAQQSTDTSLVKTVVTVLTSPTAGQAEDDTAVPGTDGGVRQGAAVAAVIKFKIARRYRGGHPRLYLGGLTASALADAQNVSAAYITSTLLAWNAYISLVLAQTAPFSATAVHCNVSYFAGFTNHTFPSGRIRPIPNLRVAPVIDTVLSYAMNTKLCSQRRRNLQSA